jgi:hypothetical protein
MCAMEAVKNAGRHGHHRVTLHVLLLPVALQEEVNAMPCHVLQQLPYGNTDYLDLLAQQVVQRPHVVRRRHRVALLGVLLAEQALHRHVHHIRVRIVRQRVRKRAAHCGHGPVLGAGFRVHILGFLTLSAERKRSASRA